MNKKNLIIFIIFLIIGVVFVYVVQKSIKYFNNKTATTFQGATDYVNKVVPMFGEDAYQLEEYISKRLEIKRKLDNLEIDSDTFKELTMQEAQKRHEYLTNRIEKLHSITPPSGLARYHESLINSCEEFKKATDSAMGGNLENELLHNEKAKNYVNQAVAEYNAYGGLGPLKDLVPQVGKK